MTALHCDTDALRHTPDVHVKASETQTVPLNLRSQQARPDTTPTTRCRLRSWMELRCPCADFFQQQRGRLEKLPLHLGSACCIAMLSFLASAPYSFAAVVILDDQTSVNLLVGRERATVGRASRSSRSSRPHPLAPSCIDRGPHTAPWAARRALPRPQLQCFVNRQRRRPRATRPGPAGAAVPRGSPLAAGGCAPLCAKTPWDDNYAKSPTGKSR